MSFEEKINELYKDGQDKYLEHLSIDCVIFGFHENELKVLLLKPKYASEWALPGGFIAKQEDLNDAATRILKERTGLNEIYLRQFQAFGSPQRSTKKVNEHFLKNVGITTTKSWMFERFVTVGYYSLVDFTKVEPKADIFSDSCKWFNIHNIPGLILDHREILQTALQHLQLQLNYYPIGHNLLPAKFTMPELQKLYETILDRMLDRRNFQRKMMASGILKRLNETKKGVAHKAPYYYNFDLRKYRKAVLRGLGFENE
jgi:ADP-ribose pyrophosphatase YjhB (NUDIX family)